MKSLLSFGLVLSISVASFAQITLSNANFPVAGVILKSVTVALPTGVTITEAGPNQVWMIAEQATAIPTETEYLAASEGANVANYPNADLVVIGAAGAGETYYNATVNYFQVVGFSGPLAGQLPVETALQFDPAINERVAPREYGDVSTSEGAVLVPLSSDILPDTLFAGLPFQPDSLRIRIAINRTEFVDAWGTMFLLGSNAFEVLRTRRFETTETRLDVLLPFVGWFDATDLVPLDFLGIDTTLSYIYMSNTAKEPIAIYTMNAAGDEVTQLQHKDVVPFYSSTTDIAITELVVAPNPAQNECIVTLPTHINTGTTLLVTDMLGRNIKQLPVANIENHQIRLDVTDLMTGNYIISLTDSAQQKIGRARIAVAH